MIKESIHTEDIMILNVYASNNRASNKYMKQKLIEVKEERDKPTNLVRKFYIFLLAMDRTSRQKIIKVTDLNNTINRI